MIIIEKTQALDDGGNVIVEMTNGECFDQPDVMFQYWGMKVGDRMYSVQVFDDGSEPAVNLPDGYDLQQFKEDVSNMLESADVKGWNHR